jgi:hypothetical protein
VELTYAFEGERLPDKMLPLDSIWLNDCHKNRLFDRPPRTYVEWIMYAISQYDEPMTPTAMYRVMPSFFDHNSSVSAFSGTVTADNELFCFEELSGPLSKFIRLRRENNHTLKSRSKSLAASKSHETRRQLSLFEIQSSQAISGSRSTLHAH